MSKIDNTLSFSYFGFNGFLEEEIAKKNNIKFIGIDRTKNRFKFYLKNDCIKEIKELKIKPDVIISTGGGHSYHILKYAKKNQIPYYLIEENVVMGLTNKLFYRKSQGLFSPFKFRGKKYINAAHPSSLITNKDIKIEYDFLFLGGSLGSDIISKLAIKMRNMPYKSLLICGRKKDKYIKYQNKNLHVEGFVNLEEYYNKSDIVVSRAGASTLFEMLTCNKKMIIIPSKKTRGNHQVLNAEFFKNNNLGIYLDEKSASVNCLLEISKYSFTDIIKSQKKYLEQLSYKPYEIIITRVK